MYFIIFAPEQQGNDLLEGPSDNLYFGGSLGKFINMYNDNVLSYDMNNDFSYTPNLLYFFYI